MHEVGNLEWTMTTERKFETIKERLCWVPILALPNFNLLFTLAKRSLAYFSEKLSDPKLNHSTYDKECYTIIQALTH